MSLPLLFTFWKSSLKKCIWFEQRPVFLGILDGPLFSLVHAILFVYLFVPILSFPSVPPNYFLFAGSRLGSEHWALMLSLL